MRSSVPHALAAPPSSHSSNTDSIGAADIFVGLSFMLDLEAPKPGTTAGVGILDEVDGVGEGTPKLGLGDVVALEGRGIVLAIAEWTSLLDICFERDEIAHPAIAPAAPVAELTRPA